MSNNESFYTPPTLPNGDRDRRKEIEAWKRERNSGSAPLDLTVIVVIDNLLDALDEARKQRDDAKRECADANDERVFSDYINERMDRLLTATANAVHGGPPENGMHTWHNLPELVEKMRKEVQ